MKRNETISNFGQFDKTALEGLQANLRLSLPLHTLLSIATYYQNRLRRDPLAEELLILDRLSRTAGQFPENFLITAFSTNDSAVAETYADMMQKRAALSPNAETPPSLSELFALAGNYLSRAGKQNDGLGASFLLEDATASPSSLTCRSYITASAAKVGLRAFAKTHLTPAADDLWVTLAPADGEKNIRYRAALERVWSIPELTCSFTNVRALDRRGLLPALLESGAGFTLDLSKLNTEGFVFDRVLVSDASGEYLLRLPADRYLRVSRELRRMGIRASAIAVVGCDRVANLLFPNGTRASWEFDFLKSLLPLASCEVKLPDETDGMLSAIESKPLTLENARYLTANACANSAWLNLQCGAAAAVAVSQPMSRFFENALRTTLSAVMTLTAAGCRYTRQAIAVGLTLPLQSGDPKCLGEAIATLLGVYRAQAELGLPMAAGKIFFSPTCKHPEITVFALTGEPTVESIGFRSPDHPIYCLAPKGDETLDFEDLRRLLAMVADLRRNGEIAAVRPMLGETLGEAIAATDSNCVTATLNTEVASPTDCPKLAFLLEAARELDATPIGQTAEKACEKATPKAPARLQKVTCLIPSLVPEVVLLDTCRNPDLRLLADRLEEKGAKVRVFTTDDLVSITHLCRAILGAETLIVAPDVEIPNDPYLGFALRTLARAHGRILFPARENAPEMAGAIALPDGLSDEILWQISKK